MRLSRVAVLLVLILAGSVRSEQTPDIQGRAPLPFEEALRVLKKKDPDGGKRLHAVESLAQLATAAREAVPVLLTVLKDDDVGEVRAEAARALGRIGPNEKVVPALKRALEDEDRLVGVRAAEALGLADPASEAAAVAFLVESLEYSRRRPEELPLPVVLHSLMQLGPRARPAVPALLSHLRQLGFRQQLNFLFTLDEIQADQAELVGPLIAMLKSDMTLERFRTLGEYSRPIFRPLFTGQLSEINGNVSLGNLQEELRVHTLMQRDAHKTAIEILGRIGPPARPATPVLKQFLNDRYLGKAAHEALDQISRQR
jgi:HEAT repeat protein